MPPHLPADSRDDGRAGPSHAGVFARGLVIARGGRRVAGPLDFALAPGDALLVTGPNGSGKTTLLRTLAGFLAAEAGETTELGEAAHYLGHRDGVKAALTLAENVRFSARIAGVAAPDATAALARVGLGGLVDTTRAGALSAGQRRRLGIARLVAAPRPVWLLDEPTTALDTASQAGFARLCADHLAGGGSIVVATHLPIALDFTHRLEL